MTRPEEDRSDATGHLLDATGASRGHGDVAASDLASWREPTARPLSRSDDDYLLALAISRRACLVTGDQDVLVLGSDLPILTPAQFATKLRDQP